MNSGTNSVDAPFRIAIVRISDIYARLYNARHYQSFVAGWRGRRMNISFPDINSSLEIKWTHAWTSYFTSHGRYIKQYARFLRYLNYFQWLLPPREGRGAKTLKRTSTPLIPGAINLHAFIFHADCNSLLRATRYILLNIVFSNIISLSLSLSRNNNNNKNGVTICLRSNNAQLLRTIEIAGQNKCSSFHVSADLLPVNVKMD